MSDEEILLRRALAALGPYRNRLVLVGAWAHRFFLRHPQAQALDHELLMTNDADLAAPEELGILDDPIQGKSPWGIPRRLEEAGFDVRLAGSTALPVMKFFARESSPRAPALNAEFYVELIAPLIGGETDRQGEPRLLVQVGGATAKLLRHVELLLFEPWTLELDQGIGVQVANPASYLAQKCLTRREGADRHQKQGKDLLYIHDTLLMFGPALRELRPLGARVLAQLDRSHATKVQSFNFSSDPARLDRAARIAGSTGRPSPPDGTAIAATCQFGWAVLFGP